MIHLSVVAPLTEASVEYQAIAYSVQHPETHWQRDRATIVHKFYQV